MIVTRLDPDDSVAPEGNLGGLYLLMDGDDSPVYIGVCINWRARRYGHYRMPYWPAVKSVLLLRWWDKPLTAEEYVELERNEYRMIRMFRPPANRRYVQGVQANVPCMSTIRRDIRSA